MPLKELKHPDGRVVKVEAGSVGEKEFVEAGFKDPSAEPAPKAADPKADTAGKKP